MCPVPGDGLNLEAHTFRALTAEIALEGMCQREIAVRAQLEDALHELFRDQLVLPDHGVTADYVREMRSAGFQVSHEELVRARDHGVTADFLKRMRDVGYDKLPLDEYIRMRDHGVTPDYVQSMRELGYTNLTASELVRMRDHGVTARSVRRVKELFKESPSAEQLIRMRSDGEIGLR